MTPSCKRDSSSTPRHPEVHHPFYKTRRSISRTSTERGEQEGAENEGDQKGSADITQSEAGCARGRGCGALHGEERQRVAVLLERRRQSWDTITEVTLEDMLRSHEAGVTHTRLHEAGIMHRFLLLPDEERRLVEVALLHKGESVRGRVSHRRR